MVSSNLSKSESVLERWLELALIGFITLLCVEYIRISGKRYFNFDEFQVLYASAAQLRGKSLYADSIGLHFPFFNMIMSILIAVSGFKTTTLLVARYFVLMVHGVTLFFTYRTTQIIWDKRTGLWAVALTLSSFVFLNRGIEIRHDVFNTLFIIMGGYFGLRYTREKKYSNLILSALMFGWALASTQKAIICSGGMMLGMSLYLLHRKHFEDFFKSALVYMVLLWVPLILCISYLILMYDESFSDFLSRTVFHVAVASIRPPNDLFPFPYDRFAVIGNLLYQNALFYALGCGGMLAGIIDWWRNGSEKIVVATGALLGALFFLLARRPFYQTLLPAIPLLAIMASGMVQTIWGEFERQDLHKRAGLGMVCLLLLFLWPVLVIVVQEGKDRPMTSQLDNVSFCLASLGRDDKVLSFTKNQVFFDPVLGTYNDECGQRFMEYDATCFEKRMIREQCKVIINDHRTSLLNEEIQKKISDNYIRTGVGDILIPGFRLPAGAVVRKKIWIQGIYKDLSGSIGVDGKKVNGGLIHLDQSEYTFRNISNTPAFLVYVFHPDKGLTRSPF